MGTVALTRRTFIIHSQESEVAWIDEHSSAVAQVGPWRGCLRLYDELVETFCTKYLLARECTRGRRLTFILVKPDKVYLMPLDHLQRARMKSFR